MAVEGWVIVGGLVRWEDIRIDKLFNMHFDKFVELRHSSLN